MDAELAQFESNDTENQAATTLKQRLGSETVFKLPLATDLLTSGTDACDQMGCVLLHVQADVSSKAADYLLANNDASCLNEVRHDTQENCL